MPYKYDPTQECRLKADREQATAKRYAEIRARIFPGWTGEDLAKAQEKYRFKIKFL